MGEVNGGLLALGLIMLLVLTPIGFLLFIIPGIILLIVSILLIVMSVTGGSQVPQVPQVYAPQPGYVLCPACQGQNYQSSVYCQWCGKPMKAQA